MPQFPQYAFIAWKGTTLSLRSYQASLTVTIQKMKNTLHNNPEVAMHLEQLQKALWTSRTQFWSSCRRPCGRQERSSGAAAEGPVDVRNAASVGSWDLELSEWANNSTMIESYVFRCAGLDLGNWCSRSEGKTYLLSAEISKLWIPELLSVIWWYDDVCSAEERSEEAVGFVCSYDLLTRANQINAFHSSCEALLSALLDSRLCGFVVWFSKELTWNGEMRLPHVFCVIFSRIGLDVICCKCKNLSSTQLMKSGDRPNKCPCL